MKSFTDNAGRTWVVTVTVATVKRVRALCNVDLNTIAEIDQEGKEGADLLSRIANDPVLLVDVLYAICKPEADAAGVSDEDFGRAMAGDVITAATAAFLEGLRDFFPGARRMIIQRAQTALIRLEEAIQKRVERQAAEFDRELDAALAQLNASSTSAPGSAG